MCMGAGAYIVCCVCVLVHAYKKSVFENPNLGCHVKACSSPGGTEYNNQGHHQHNRYDNCSHHFAVSALSSMTVGVHIEGPHWLWGYYTRSTKIIIISV